MKCFPLLLICLLASLSRAAETDPLTEPANRIAPDDPAWKDLAATFARKPDTTANFSEQRFFPFKKTPVELKGESRVSAARGLSLHYTEPEERTVILDSQGVLVRDVRGENAAPADPRASAANAALVQVLRFDLPALAENFDIFGRREGAAWQLAFVPRAVDLRRAVGLIVVAGGADAVNRIEIRRTTKQYVAILIGPARPAPFTADELKQFFR
ncbi:MAG: outer membrane lipoprotein carrier protein LolA [Pedosphaera sp.]|nr:outer membrane lipoprotein carrier protein LolA [Pedosphaera sp.]